MNLDDLSSHTRVVIVDDNKEEGEAIRAALGKNNISSLFFQITSTASLPSIPFSNIRLIFLDLDFGTAAGNTPELKANTALSYLQKFVSSNSFYILVIWSSHTTTEIEKIFLDILSKRFNGALPCIAPISISKIDCKKRNQGFSCHKIQQYINKGLKSVKSYSIFYDWENSIGGAISNTFGEFLAHEGQRGLSRKLHCLAEAYAGKGYKEDIARHSLLTFNRIINDTLENSMNSKNKKYDTFNKQIFKRVSPLSKEMRSEFNTKLLFNPEKTIGPGAIFKDSISNFTDSFCRDSSQQAKLVKIAVDISPVCDFAQKKNKFSYFLHGAFVPAEVKDINDYGYHYIINRSFRYDSKLYYLVFNLRSLEAIKINKDKKLEYLKLQNRTLSGGEQIKQAIKDDHPYDDPNNFIAKFRDSITFDIQHNLSNHAFRPGFISLN